MNLIKITAAMLAASALLLAGDIKVENPFVKEIAPNMKNSAAFMSIKNSGDKKITLVSAKNDASAITELHTHGKKDVLVHFSKVVGQLRQGKVEQIGFHGGGARPGPGGQISAARRPGQRDQRA